MLRRKRMHIAIAGLLLAASTCLSACHFDEPTRFTTQKMEVHEEDYHGQFEAAKLDDATLKQMADYYTYNGGGTVEIVVTYNPKSTANTAMRASNHAARIAAGLGKYKIKDITTELLPVHNEEVAIAYINFTTYRATAGSECQSMEDIEDSLTENYRKYMLGCSTQSFMANQISKPTDLLGRETDEESSGRKHANTIELYKWGADLSDEVETEEASE